MSTEDTRTPEEIRAAWIAGMRKVLGILEANPHLPLPGSAPQIPVTFWPRDRYEGGDPRRDMAELERLLPAEFEARTEDMGSSKDYWYILSGDAAGAPVQIKVKAANVAEERITGHVYTPVTEWVRLSVEAQKPEGNEAA